MVYAGRSTSTILAEVAALLTSRFPGLPTVSAQQLAERFAGHGRAAGPLRDHLAQARIQDLLTVNGAITQPLQRVGDALLAAGTGEAVWRWLAPDHPTAALITAIRDADAPVTHDLLDTLTQRQALHRLRAVLVQHGVLPARAEHLERIEPWLERHLTAVSAAHAQLVRTWARWTLHRRARQRLSRISRLHTDDVLHNPTSSGTNTYLLLGSHRLRIAPTVAALLHAQTDAADRHRNATTSQPRWIFPGGLPGTHTATLHTELARHHMPRAARGRATALINLAAELPPPLLVDLLGISIGTANHYARHASTDWSAYLNARTIAAT